MKCIGPRVVADSSAGKISQLPIIQIVGWFSTTLPYILLTNGELNPVVLLIFRSS